MTEDNVDLVRRTVDCTRRLRQVTYGVDDVLAAPVSEPFHFHAGTYGGEFPVIVFSSYRCDKYIRGLCAPCFYSGLPHSNAPRADVYAALPTQAQALLDRFDDWVVARQPGRGGELPYVLQIAGEGSFLRNAEIPTGQRMEMLRMFADDARKRQISVSYNLETKAEDVISAEARGEFDNYGELRSQLNLSLAIGYESADPFIRNVVFAKELDEKHFDRAVSIALRYDLTPIAYIYAGGHGLSDIDIINSVRQTVRRLRELGVGIYLMLPNLQPFTLPHLLWDCGRHQLPSPETVLQVLEVLLEGAPRRNSPHAWLGRSDWMIGGITSTPDPLLTFYGSILDTTVRNRLSIAIDRLQKEQDAEAFHRAVDMLGFVLPPDENDSTPDTPTLPTRIAEMLTVAEGAVDEYIARFIRPRQNRSADHWS